MKADFTRLNFDLDKHYTRVLQQQGRVTLDADWNEHVTIQADLDRKRLIDVIGGCGVPHGGQGFDIDYKDGELTISDGVIYVDGLRIKLDTKDEDSANDENPQPFWPSPALPEAPTDGNPRVDLVYLRVWEHHVTYLEDDAIREVALGGPDTTTRVKTVWQVRVVEDVKDKHCQDDLTALPDDVGDGKLTTDTATPSADEDPCNPATDSGYRGLENRLYRVEVHQKGKINGEASIKWSRYNGAIALNVDNAPGAINAEGRTIRLKRLGWDQIRTLKPNDWIEIVSENDELNCEPGAMVQIAGDAGAVDEVQHEITIKNNQAYIDALTKYNESTSKVKVRLWDGEEAGEIKLAQHLASDTSTKPIDLKDGIDITLSVENKDDEFRSGDYWTFTARTIPGPDGSHIDRLKKERPHGPHVHCCKLALLHWDGTSSSPEVKDCRPIFPSLTELVNLYYVSGDGQEAMPGDWLPKPLVVRVNHGQYPVKNVPVTFAREPSVPGGTLRTEEGINNSQSHTILTDEEGFAQVTWRLGSKRGNWSQQVVAYIGPPAAPPVRPYQPQDHRLVRFSANLSVAEKVAYKPPESCPNLNNTTTVAAALDKLCNSTAEQVTYEPPEPCPNLTGTTNVADALDALCYVSGGDQDPGFHVTGVFWNYPDDDCDFEARNDEQVNLERFVHGMWIRCDEQPDKASVSHATCYLQLEYRDSPTVPIFTQITIPGIVYVSAETKGIYWYPTKAAKEWFLVQLATKYSQDKSFLARLTLKGSFIWQDGNPDVYLDGEAFGMRGTPHNLRPFPSPTGDPARISGNGKRGGDFEMWFRLIQDSPIDPPPEPEGELDWVIDGVSHLETFDPVKITESQDITVINLLYAGLVRLVEGDEGLEVAGDLAKCWIVEEEERVYSFYLRDNLLDSNGNELTASDVKDSLDRARNPDNSATGPIYLSNIESIETDASNAMVKITLKKPSRYFLQRLTTAPAKIVITNKVEGNIGFVEGVTSGAFRLDEVNDSTLKLANNPYYWQRAGVELVNVRYVPSRAQAVAEYAGGFGHIVGSVQTGLPDSAREFEDEFHAYNSSCAIRYLGFNRRDERGLLNNDEANILLAAISYAIDRDCLVDGCVDDDENPIFEGINEGAIAARRILPPCIKDVPAPDESMPRYDPDHANRRLDDLGYTDNDGDGIREDHNGEPLEFTLCYAEEQNTVNAKAVEFIANNLRDVKIGIIVEAWPLREFSRWLGLMAVDPYDPELPKIDIFFSIWTADYRDPQNLLSQQLHSIRDPEDYEHFNNNGHYENIDFDHYVEYGDTLTRDATDFPSTYMKAEGLALNQGAWVPLFYPQPRALIRPNVKGIALTGQGLIVTDFSKLTLEED